LNIETATFADHHTARWRVLLVESDPAFALEASGALERAGCIVEYVATGHRGMQRGLSVDFDAIVLARALPDIDGLSVLATYRNLGKDTPVLIVSAPASLEDRLQVLARGGDDHMTEPVDKSELVARLGALIRRRSQGSRGSCLRAAGLALDRTGCVVQRMETNIRTTRPECIVLEQLMLGCGRAVSRRTLHDAVAVHESAALALNIDGLVKQLRRKLSLNRRLPPLIHTVVSVGFMLRAFD
jgi:two-component system, OmpR family, response regulator